MFRTSRRAGSVGIKHVRSSPLEGYIPDNASFKGGILLQYRVFRHSRHSRLSNTERSITVSGIGKTVGVKAQGRREIVGEEIARSESLRYCSVERRSELGKSIQTYVGFE